MTESDQFWSRVQEACRRLGVSQKTLSQRSGLSRTTLYQLSQGKTARPQDMTVHRIATALGVSVASLTGDPEETTATEQTEAERFRQFNEQTNPRVEEVKEAAPELFEEWSQTDWEELYSCFGVGGALSEEGVREEARRINEKRELLRRVEVILETHLRSATIGLINSLYESVIIKTM
jgi:Predicted transcriptional regulators